MIIGRRRIDWLVVLISICLGVLLLNLFYLAAYLFVFERIEARHVVSYNRYIGTYLIAVAFIILGKYGSSIVSNYRWNKWACIFIIISLSVFSVLAMPKDGFYLLKPGPGQISAGYRSQYIDKAKLVLQHAGEHDPTYILFQKTSGLLFRIVKYEISPVPTNEWKNPDHSWSIGPRRVAGDIYTQEFSPAQFSEVLANRYKFVYLGRVDEPFWSQYGQLFETPIPKDQFLYKVDKSTTPLVTLRPVSFKKP